MLGVIDMKMKSTTYSFATPTLSSEFCEKAIFVKGFAVFIKEDAAKAFPQHEVELSYIMPRRKPDEC